MSEQSLAVRDEHQLDGKTLLSVVSAGDCAALSAEQKVMYYRARCEAAGLDYRAQPFQFIKLQGKEVLYATKAATDQLASKHGVVCEIVSQITENGVRTVTIRARTRDGRQTDEIGCVSVGNAVGDQLCNVHMKAVTKGKRRAILSLCGLGMLDETELETIPNASAPPSLPLPPRRSEKAKQASPPSPSVIEAPAANVESANGELDAASGGEVPILVPETGDNPLDDAVIRASVADVMVKSGGQGDKKWTLYGVGYTPLDGRHEPGVANTFDKDWGKLAEKAKEAGLVARLTIAPSKKYPGKFDLTSFEVEEG